MRSTASILASLSILNLATASPVSKRWADESGFDLAGVDLPTSLDYSNPLPLDDGFPTPSDAQVQKIQVGAHGTLPTSPPPDQLSDASLFTVKIIDFAERLEAVFFEELLFNITSHQPGFEVPGYVEYDFVVKTLSVIQHTEELHNLVPVSVLEHLNATGSAPGPCTKYNFPVTTFDQGFELASALTSGVYAFLGDAIKVAAENNDPPEFIRLLAQVLAAEGEQGGYFRYLQGKTPQEQPFTTAAPREFIVNALKSFVDTSSCPNIESITLPTYPSLNTIDAPGPADATIRYAVPAQGFNGNQDLWITYLHAVNAPISLPVTVGGKDNSGENVILSAGWPYKENILDGFTLAVLTTTNGPFASVDDVPDVTINGPALITVN